jgi:hypothetical protein
MINITLIQLLKPANSIIIPVWSSLNYCISVEESFFDIICVESYQHGGLFQYSGRQSIEAQSSYVEITDENEINRLKKVGRKILSDHGIAF